MMSMVARSGSYFAGECDITLLDSGNMPVVHETHRGSGPKSRIRPDAIQVPALRVPGLRPVSVKGIQTALSAARTLP